MRNLNEIDQYRRQHPTIPFIGDETCGYFEVPSPFSNRILRVIARANQGWDHISISNGSRTPTWDEMEYVKRMFFLPEEWAMQLHAPPADHINVHPGTLHIWRPHDSEIPVPPREFV